MAPPNCSASSGFSAVTSSSLRSPASLLFGYWVAMGAWRRTSWGRPASDAEIIGPPVLTASRARQMIVVAGGCVTAVTVALALQLIAARS